jgi:hypothetical protein
LKVVLYRIGGVFFSKFKIHSYSKPLESLDFFIGSVHDTSRSLTKNLAISHREKF